MELAIVDPLAARAEGFAFDYLNDPGVQPKFQGLTTESKMSDGMFLEPVEAISSVSKEGWLIGFRDARFPGVSLPHLREALSW